MKFGYTFKNIEENMAKASGRDLSISTKHSVEICNAIRGKSLEKAKGFLERVMAQEEAVPLRRFNSEVAHQTAVGPGRYPIKTAAGILGVLKSAESNAQSKGLSTKDLVVLHIAAHKAASPWHYGRKRRLKMKRTHIEVVLAEKPSAKKEDAPKHAVKKAAKTTKKENPK